MAQSLFELILLLFGTNSRLPLCLGGGLVGIYEGILAFVKAILIAPIYHHKKNILRDNHASCMEMPSGKLLVGYVIDRLAPKPMSKKIAFKFQLCISHINILNCNCKTKYFWLLIHPYWSLLFYFQGAKPTRSISMKKEASHLRGAIAMGPGTSKRVFQKVLLHL